jgi:hypothetical protein
VGWRGRKRQLDLEPEYWKLLQSGVGTVAACKLLGTGWPAVQLAKSTTPSSALLVSW